MEVKNLDIYDTNVGRLDQKFIVPRNQTEESIFKLDIVGYDTTTHLYDYCLEDAIQLRQFLKDVIRKYRDDNQN